MLHLGPGASRKLVPPSPDVPSRIPSAAFQPFLIGDDLRQTTALKQTLSIFLTLLVFLLGGFVHASVDSSFRSKRPSSDLFTVSESSIIYIGRGRLKSFITADGDLIQYQYDASNNLTRLTYPDGKQVNYTYNARNLLETVTDWSNRTTTYTYDRLGRLTGTLRPNGTANQIAHDAANQLTSIKETSGGKLINYLAFQYDAASQIKSRFRAPLVNSGWQHPALVATYDDDNRLLTANGINVTHDADGNMTRSVGILPTSLSTAVDLTYNSRNQLTNAAGITYTYDAEGRRRTFTDTTGTTRDTIDPSGKLLVRTHPNGTKTYYVYGLGLLYEANQADATKTYHFDQVGSTLLRTDDSGKVIGQAEYSAYGLITWKQGDMATPFLYNGQAGVQTDPNGLLNMRARYYSPYLMRFLNADPIGFSGGSNWFAYADGNPISRADPFGLESFMFPPQYAQSSEFRAGFQQGANQGLVIGSAITVGAATTIYTGGAAGPYVAAALGEGTAAMLTTAAISGAVGGGASQVTSNALTGQSLGSNIGSSMAWGAGLNAAGAVVGQSINAFQQGYNLGQTPQSARNVLAYVEANGTAPPGFQGGRTFANDGRGGGQVLPRTDAAGRPVTYNEFDVNPFTKGVNRGAERLVRGSNGSAHYTNDHYGTFKSIK
jgi:RHS repeat-associated protein